MQKVRKQIEKKEFYITDLLKLIRSGMSRGLRAHPKIGKTSVRNPLGTDHANATKAQRKEKKEQKAGRTNKGFCARSFEKKPIL